MKCRSKTDEIRHQAAASRKLQRLQSTFSEEHSEFGPPDKQGHFRYNQKEIKIGQRVEVYDDDIWYRGKLIEFHKKTAEWIAQFDIDGDKTSIKFPEDVHLLQL